VLQKISVTLFILLTFSAAAKSQINIDSLNSIYTSSKIDTTKIGALFLICEQFTNSKPDTSLKLCKKGLQLLKASKKSKTPHFLKMQAQFYNLIGIAYRNKSIIDSSLMAHQHALALRKKIHDKDGMATAYNSIGIIFRNQGLNSKALDLYYKVYKIREELKDTMGLAYVLNNIGSVFKEQKNYPKAVDYYKKSLALFKQLKKESGIAGVLNNLAVIYFNTDDHKNAKLYYQQAYEIFEKSQHQIGMALTLCGLGTTETNLHNYDEAEKLLNQSLTIYLANKNVDGAAFVTHCMTEQYIAQNNYNKALKSGLLSLKLSKESGYPENIKFAAQDLKKVYLHMGNYKNAYEMFELGLKMRDSLTNDETRSKSLQKEFQYSFEKKSLADSIHHEEEIKLNKAKVAIKDEQLKRESFQRYVLYGGLLLLLVFGVFMYNRFKVTSRQKNIIDKQKTEVMHQKELVEEKNKEILDSINYAKRLQEAILPPLKLVKEYLSNSFILYKPKDIVAGDFYFMEPLNNKIIFAAADCTGHGVPGAMVSVVCANALNRTVKEFGIEDAGEILNKVRELVVDTFSRSENEVKDGMDISLCVLDTTTNTLYWSGANNPLWILRTNSQAVEEYKPNKQPIGRSYEPTPFNTHNILLEKGDTLYIFTDGYEDQFGGDKGKKFKSAKMKELFISLTHLPMEEQCIKINDSFESWRGQLEQVDDVCIIGVRI
jgi:serine phosphatase RsbU (regulator of sigma subunit)